MKRLDVIRQFGGVAAVAGAFALPRRAFAATENLVPVSVGVTGSSSDVPFFIADEFGYFRDAGIAARFVSFAGAPMMVAPLGTGQLDVGSGSPSAGLFNAVASGIDVRIVADKGRCAPGYGYGPLMVRKSLVTSGAFKTIRDLKGLKVAEAAQGGTSSSSLARLLATVGLKYSDVGHAFLSFPDQTAAFAGGAIDASLSNEPSATQAERLGVAVRITGNDSWYPNQEVASVLYGTSLLHDRYDVGVRFMTAWIRAARFFNAGLANGHLRGRTSPAILTMLVTSTPIKDRSTYVDMIAQYVDPNGAVNTSSVREDLAFWKQQGWVTSNVAVEQAVDMSYVEAALKSLGSSGPTTR